MEIQFYDFDLRDSSRLAISEPPLTSEPSKTGAKDSREKSMAARSLQVELLEHSEGSQSFGHTDS